MLLLKHFGLGRYASLIFSDNNFDVRYICGYDLIIRVVQGDQLLENKEKKESLELKQSKFDFFFYPQTISGDIGRVILGSIILLVMFGAVVLIMIGLALTAYSNTVGAGLLFMLVLYAGLIFVVLPGIGLLTIYFLLRRLRIVFSRKS